MLFHVDYENAELIRREENEVRFRPVNATSA